MAEPALQIPKAFNLSRFFDSAPLSHYEATAGREWLELTAADVCADPNVHSVALTGQDVDEFFTAYESELLAAILNAHSQGLLNGMPFLTANEALRDKAVRVAADESFGYLRSVAPLALGA